MVAITFGVLSVAVCAFLIYVLVHFHLELVRLQKRSEDSGLTYIGSREPEAALLVPHTDERQEAKPEAVMRREILTSAILGLFGLLAPFISFMLLSSSSTWHH